MGLDMELIKKYYIGAEFEHNNVTGTIDISNADGKISIDLKEVKYIECNAVYWRKANMIHKWFVDHVQEGNDDCKQYYVDRSQLKELLSTCKHVLENPENARELLPTLDGFYFGGTLYDEDYFNDIIHTVEELSKLDLEGNDLNFSYYYESSW